MANAQLDCLIIDDEKDICEVLKIYCENLGVFRNIIVARDGIVGTNKLHNQKFGLILLDINMPKKSGLDVLKEFEGDHKNSFDSVIVVSGELDKTKLSAILGKGVKNFIIKPFTEAQFQEKVIPILKANLAKAKK
ncbi:response regulator [Halobacteriovorax sp. HLS]|uniref:response regulator n=1 Tax=Halobacteriovorax sp. HLS TaxID=2234000 RepID=UPI000FD6DEE5|nr:response regulator [Halobacteriovorax sp. HLS]